MTTHPALEIVARALIQKAGGTQAFNLPRDHDAVRYYMDSARLALTALSSAGWAVVPREPTEAMIDAALDVPTDGKGFKRYIADMCKAMLAASATEQEKPQGSPDALRG